MVKRLFRGFIPTTPLCCIVPSIHIVQQECLPDPTLNISGLLNETVLHIQRTKFIRKEILF